MGTIISLQESEMAFPKAGQVGSTAVTTLPINPATIMMAVTLYSI